jgi:hypothetical protein
MAHHRKILHMSDKNLKDEAARLRARRWLAGWYSQALEVLGPLRWHIEELLKAAEDHNRAADRLDHIKFSEDKIVAARAAQKLVEDFFTKPQPKLKE